MGRAFSCSFVGWRTGTHGHASHKSHKVIHHCIEAWTDDKSHRLESPAAACLAQPAFVFLHAGLSDEHENESRIEIIKRLAGIERENTSRVEFREPTNETDRKGSDPPLYSVYTDTRCSHVFSVKCNCIIKRTNGPYSSSTSICRHPLLSLVSSGDSVSRKGSRPVDSSSNNDQMNEISSSGSSASTLEPRLRGVHV